MPTRPNPATHVPLPLTPEDAPAPRPAPAARRGPSGPARWLTALAFCLVSIVLPACDGPSPHKTCGNGRLDPGEACDPALPTTPCATLGFYEGEATCRADCTLDRSACAGYCGDGVLQTAGAEECDGDDLGEATCQDFRRFFGALRCSSSCRLLAGECRDTLVWGTERNDGGADITVAPNGDVYVVGYTTDTTDEQAAHTADSDVLITRFGADGILRWTRQFGSEGDDGASAIALGPDGGIYVVGAIEREFEAPVVGECDAFLARFDPDGNRLWVRQWGSTGFDVCSDVTVDGDGNIYVSGYTTGALEDQTLTGGYDAFLVRFTADGERVWMRQWGSERSDSTAGVVVDSTGAIFVAGTTDGVIDGQTPAGRVGVFLTKFSPDGVRLQTTIFGADVSTTASALAIDAADRLYVTGSTSEHIEGPQEVDWPDAFLARFDPDGEMVWFREWGLSWIDDVYGLGLDPEGNPAVAGARIPSATNPASDIFLTRFTQDGQLVETLTWGATATDDRCSALAVDGQGHAYITGYTASALNGEPPIGEYDAYIIYVP